MILILILSLIWFLTGKKVPAVIAFFFFVTDGFQIVPFSFFSFFGIDIKPTDYALLLFALILIIYFFIHKLPSVKQRILPQFTYLFIGYVIIGTLISRYSYGISWNDIIRTSRPFILLFSPVLFYFLDKEEIEKIKKILFKITLFLCSLFILQVILDIPLLNGYAGGYDNPFLGITIPRYYNIPFLLPYFIYYGIYQNEYSTRKQKYFILFLLFAPIILSLHRNLIMTLIFIGLINFYLDNKNKSKKFKNTIIAIIVCIPFSGILIDSMNSRGTGSDIKHILAGDFSAYANPEEFENATLFFRMSMLYERAHFIFERPMTTLFGLGYMHENSQYTQNHFDFKLGIRDETTNNILQIDTSDIAWAPLLIRLGIVGIVIYMLYYFTLLNYFRKLKNTKIKITGRSYLLLIFFTSIANVYLFTPMMLLPILLDYSGSLSSTTTDDYESK
ncbi:hypothetical protein [Coprobacter tertius]|uniref:Uncharacterized protein n=1 Tax=Coprobacter tertius TaxID=2944915 RepID=A0ABT1MNJ4_9BACT|nr:hypothetical protein [Coprobacter tertius]MCP9612861.1 hypothetical protein [Coprobacter tertius]